MPSEKDSKSELLKKAKKADKLEKKEKKREETGVRFVQKAAMGGLGILTAGLSSLVITKKPRLRSFDKGGKVPTRAVFGGVLVFAGLWLDDDDGVLPYALIGGGAGMALPGVSDWVAAQDFAQPKAA